ncbi:MAG TPA: class I SAM-dependent methyltransferase [Anaerolineaceae bacterium]|nr:class I SAM-dependent methyltransferase [Anaerolineaceae bacterium]
MTVAIYLTDYNYAMDRYPTDNLPGLLTRALQRRQPLLAEPHHSALRLFNGFYEGFPSLVVDLYARTLVVFTHKLGSADSLALTQMVRDVVLSQLDWIGCVLLKQRSSMDPAAKQGGVVHGSRPDTSIMENGVRYALDLRLNQDAGFYLDTRGLRAWLKENCGDKTVLNTFAYTGSLGVAALAGGAARVTQIDRSARFLDMAWASLRLNELEAAKMKTSAVDFFVAAGQMRRRRETFDIVIIDPPFFSITPRGQVDQVKETTRLINKARPLVAHGGYLVVVNNALFLSGQEYLRELENLAENGLLAIEHILQVGEDVTGYPDTVINQPPVDPTPFNHPTKMVIIKVKHKTGQS